MQGVLDMASAKGYRSYRGRASKIKILLAVLLCLIILAAAVVIFLQEHMVYDENGVRHLEIPWLERDESPQEPDFPPPEDLDLVIEEPAGLPAIRAFSLPAEAVTEELWQECQGAARLSSAVPYDAVALTLKDSGGNVYFDSTAAASSAVKVKQDTAETLTAITASDLHTVARLSCLLDPPAARTHVTDWGLKNTGGYIFYDGNNHNWLDPAKPGTVEYLSALAVEAAALGFDELLLTDVSYPTEGKLDKIAYTGEEVLSQNLTALLQALQTALEPYDMLLSLELPETVLSSGRDDTAGLALAEVAPLVDRIYAVSPASQAEELAAAVRAANETTDFVPELALEAQAAGAERCLVLPQEAP